MATTNVQAAPGTVPDLAELHRTHYRSLLRLASLLVEDLATCEELVQDAFVATLTGERTFRDGARVPAYLRSAVLNGARTHLRRRRMRERARPLQVAATFERSAECGALVADEHRRVLMAVRSLPERQKEVLALRYYLELSESEIAETLGIAAGTVKTHARRGLAALHQLLEDRR